MGLADRMSSFMFPGASVEQFYWVIGIGVILIIALIILQTRIAARNRARQRENGLRLVRETAEEKGLTADEEKLLVAWADAGRIKDLGRIIADPAVFEACVQNVLWELQKLDEISKAEVAEQVTAVRRKLGFDKVQYGRSIRSSKELMPGQEVKVEVAADGAKDTYNSRVTGSDERALTIESPRKEGRPLTFEKNEEIALRLVRAGDGEYLLRTNVLAADGDTLKLRQSSRLERIQQRDHVRVDVNVPVSFHVVPSPKYPDKDAPVLRPEDAVEGLIKDLSTGGAKIEVQGSELAEDTRYLNLKFTIQQTVFENVTVEIKKVIGAGSLKYVMVEFRTISEDERSQIFMHITQDQIWRKKGTY